MLCLLLPYTHCPSPSPCHPWWLCIRMRQRCLLASTGWAAMTTDLLQLVGYLCNWPPYFLPFSAPQAARHSGTLTLALRSLRIPFNSPAAVSQPVCPPHPPSSHSRKASPLLLHVSVLLPWPCCTSCFCFCFCSPALSEAHGACVNGDRLPVSVPAVSVLPLLLNAN